MVREVFVAETDEQAWELSVGGMMGRMMREYFLPLLGQFGFLQYLKHDPSVPDSDVTPEYCAKHNWLIGSPKTVARQVGGGLSTTSADLADCWCLASITRTIRTRGKRRCGLLAEQVAPRIKHLTPA